MPEPAPKNGTALGGIQTFAATVSVAELQDVQEEDEKRSGQRQVAPTEQHAAEEQTAQTASAA